MRAGSPYARGLARRIENQAAQPLLSPDFGASIDRMLSYRDQKARQEKLDKQKQSNFDAMMPIRGTTAQAGLLSSLASLENAGERRRAGAYKRGGGETQQKARERIVAQADPVMAAGLAQMSPQDWRAYHADQAEKQYREVIRRATQAAAGKAGAAERARGKERLANRLEMRDKGVLPGAGLKPEDAYRREVLGAAKIRLRAGLNAKNAMGSADEATQQRAWQEFLQTVRQSFGPEAARSVERAGPQAVVAQDEFMGPPAPETQTQPTPDEVEAFMTQAWEADNTLTGPQLQELARQHFGM